MKLGAIVFIITLRYYPMRYRKVAMNIFHVIRRRLGGVGGKKKNAVYGANREKLNIALFLYIPAE